MRVARMRNLKPHYRAMQSAAIYGTALKTTCCLPRCLACRHVRAGNSRRTLCCVVLQQRTVRIETGAQRASQLLLHRLRQAAVAYSGAADAKRPTHTQAIGAARETKPEHLASGSV
jgi:hypothetical protein